MDAELWTAKDEWSFLSVVFIGVSIDFSHIDGLLCNNVTPCSSDLRTLLISNFNIAKKIIKLATNFYYVYFLLTFWNRPKLFSDCKKNISSPKFRNSNEKFVSVGRQMKSKLMKQKNKWLVHQYFMLLRVVWNDGNWLFFY